MHDRLERAPLIPPEPRGRAPEPRPPAAASRASLAPATARADETGSSVTPRDASEEQADSVGARLGGALDGVGDVSAGRLPDAVRSVGEQHLGVDLSNVELRSDREAEERAANQGASALTEGSVVRFARGKLSTRTRAGRALLGHELVHVAQQRARGARATQAQPNPAQQALTPASQLWAMAFQRLAVSGSPLGRMLAQTGITEPKGQLFELPQPRVQLGSTELRFAARLSWGQAPFATSHPMGDTGLPKVSSAPGVTLTTFDVNIGWNSNWNINRPDDSQMAAQLAATLDHELVHVQINAELELGKYGVASAAPSDVFMHYVLLRGHPDVQTAKNNFGLPLGILKVALAKTALAEVAKPVDLDISKYENDLLDLLLNEHIAFAQSSFWFPGALHTFSGSLIATYARGWASTIARASMAIAGLNDNERLKVFNALETSPRFVFAVEQLANVTQRFEIMLGVLDREILGITAGARPSLLPSPAAPAAPVPLPGSR